MAKASLLIKKDGTVVLESDHEGAECLASKKFINLEKALEKRGEVESIELKYDPQTVQNPLTHEL